VKGLGDGFLLVFPSAAGAVGCARELQDEVAGSVTRVRIGMHTGEAQLVDGDYLGHHVNLAARVSGVAAAGEILLSTVTKQIVATAGDVRFDAPRRVRLKGIADEHELWPLTREV
jgi:class 3 adenylate cyclase